MNNLLFEIVLIIIITERGQITFSFSSSVSDQRRNLIQLSHYNFLPLLFIVSNYMYNLISIAKFTYSVVVAPKIIIQLITCIDHTSLIWDRIILRWRHSAWFCFCSSCTVWSLKQLQRLCWKVLKKNKLQRDFFNIF